MNGGPDCRGAIRRDAQMERRRDGSAKLRQNGVDAIYGLDHVCVGLAEHSEDDGRLAKRKTEVANVLDGVGDGGDVLEANGSTGVTGDNERFVLVGFEELVRVGNDDGALIVVE